MDLVVSQMWQIFQIILMIGGSLCTLLGALTIVHWFKTPTLPSDESNRINNIMSWWIGLTRPEVLAASYKAFRQDVLANVNDVEKTK